MMLILALKRLYEGVTGSLVAPFSILPGATARMNNPEGLFPSGERGKGSSASGASVCLPPPHSSVFHSLFWRRQNTDGQLFSRVRKNLSAP
ncbi:hypothetical protein [Lelliottia nimipressuralis]